MWLPVIYSNVTVNLVFNAKVTDSQERTQTNLRNWWILRLGNRLLLLETTDRGKQTKLYSANTMDDTFSRVWTYPLTHQCIIHCLVYTTRLLSFALITVNVYIDRNVRSSVSVSSALSLATGCAYKKTHERENKESECNFSCF